jgi:hypothetical protein
VSTDQNVSESLGLAESTAARALLTELFDETYDSVYRYCFARSGSHVVAEDVAAEVVRPPPRQLDGSSPQLDDDSSIIGGGWSDTGAV